jgi:hypothetical protein
MFDYHFGPMGKQLDKYGFISMYNFNYPYVDPRTGKMLPPGTISNIENARLRINAMRMFLSVFI